MYIVQAQTNSNDRWISAGITALLLVGIMVTLQMTNLPDVTDKTETYEEINWSRFRPKPKPETVAERPKPKPVEVKEPVKFEPPPDRSAPKPIKKIDLSALKSQFEPAAKPAEKLSAQKKTPQKSSAGSESKISLKKSNLLAGLNTLSGDSKSRLKITSRGNKGKGGIGVPTLKTGSGSSVGSSKSPDYGGGSLALGAPEAKKTQSGGTEIGMLDMSMMGNDFADLSPIYRELIEWMKRNPVKFKPVVARFMEKNPGDLTSIVQFKIGERSFQLHLLCKESLFEVRVCLIEGNESTYLIDRGFKENSSYLRIGSVSRTPTNQILSFGTTRKAASDNRTSDFYQIFLSWWDTAKSK